jgi:aspartate/methionine/tyrosine aminotransferase
LSKVAITIEPEFWQKAVALANKYNVLLISDFAYGETCFGDYEAPSFLATHGSKDVVHRALLSITCRPGVYRFRGES